jgi:hypothetical protein
MTTSNVFTALLGAQKEMGPVLKNSTNPAFRSKYADLSSVIETISEPLANNGLAFFQPLRYEEGIQYLDTVLVHAASGDKLQSTMALVGKDMNDPQKVGSSVTYFRRYQLLSMLGLAPEDDDGNASSGARKGSGPSAPSNTTSAPGAPSNAQKGKAKALLAEMKGAKSKAEGDAVVAEMFGGKTFDKLTGREMSKLIDDLLTLQQGPGF